MQRLAIMIFISGLVSCAGVAPESEHNSKQLNEQQVTASEIQADQLTEEQIQEKVRGQITEKLDALIEVAKEGGPETIRFWSNDLFLKAHMASIHGDAYTASILYEYLLKLTPEDNFVKSKYAIELIRIGKLAEASTVLAPLFQSDRDEKLGLILGGVYSALGDNDEAAKVYKKLVRGKEQSEEACIYLAKYYAESDKVARAFNQLQACEKRDPKNPNFSYYQGKIRVDQGKLNKALKHFRYSLKIDKSYSQAAAAMGVIYEEQKRFSKAKSTYRKFLKKNPKSPMILERLVQMLFAQEKYAEVIPYLQRLTDLDPGDLNMKVKLGVLYADNGDVKKAKKIFNDILEHVPNSDKVLYYLGALHQESGELKLALEKFAKIEKSSALYKEATMQQAQMYNLLAYEEHLGKRKQANYRQALGDFISSKVTEDESLKVDLAIIHSSFYENIEEYDKALDLMEEVAEEPQFSRNHKYYLASLYEKSKKFSKSLSLIDKMIEEDPQNAHAWNFRGYSLLSRGVKLDEAYKFIKKAIDLAPEDGFIRDSLGWYFYKKGDYKQALREIQKAQKSIPKDITITKHLAMVYEKMNNHEKAKKYYLDALKNCRFESERQEILRALRDLESDRMPASK